MLCMTYVTDGGILDIDSPAVKLVLEAALVYWGVSESLSFYGFETVSLPLGQLAATVAHGILLDPYAAGYGWFLDATPWDDEEFDELGRAISGSAADGRVDLLTVVMHELGHVLEWGHDDVPDSLMYDSLAVGQRRRVMEADVEELFANLEWQ